VHTISIHAGGHSTFVDALMTCLDEKDEAEVIFLLVLLYSTCEFTVH
jgi:hypothetical protein